MEFRFLLLLHMFPNLEKQDIILGAHSFAFCADASYAKKHLQKLA